MNYTNPQTGNLNTIKIITHIFIGLLTLIILFRSFSTVSTGSKGLKFTFGAIKDIELENGFHFKLPLIQDIKEVSIQPIQLDHKVVVGKDGAITKDNQTIGADLVIFYKYKQGKIVDMWKNYGKEKIQSIILTTTRESFKSVIGIYDIFKLPLSQDEIRAKVITEITTKLANYPIEITEVKIANYDWSDEFDQQIAETMKRAQQVKQAEQELLIAEQQSQKSVKQAEADKESAKLRAEAKALEGEGIRKYNESIAKNWDIETKLRQLEIDKIRAEHWNGQNVPEQVWTPTPLGGFQGL